MIEFLNNLLEVTGFSFVGWGTVLMWAISGILLYMGIFKQYEPLLLVPIGFGVLLANLPGAGLAVVGGDMVVNPDGSLMNLPEIASKYGILNFLYYSLIKSGILPPVIFMGVGALTDFGPMLRNLKLAFFGGAAQIGIFTVVILAVLMGYSLPEAASMGIIGGADGPTAIYTTIKLAPHMLGPIAIAAYSYMAMVPVIIPAVAKLLMTKEEFGIHMKKMDKLYPPKYEIKHLRTVKIIFPIVLTLVVSVLVPSAAPLIGMLMLGNLLKEIGTNTARLADAAAGPIMNTATVFLGVCVGATMPAEVFLRWETIGILVLGLFAFAISIAGGILVVKLYNKGSKKKINPLVGATGLSAVPMASRVANDLALKYDKSNHILQYCMSSNVSGVIGSAVAAGVLIAFLS
ncbi:MAG: sodium ion-translocating decarboxylase subunit beta [Proteiniphilum sp.]|jgi:sodium ion-translocating decarboxylase beta subunit|nr:sodium ion-translocating decarboxylase subunit beta [Proteiniphilum sp.]NCB26564.1 sodium ion-translocating decarboxylase subunit beta [Bacteroidia bacterium]MDD2938161.1 sodium ion-translocating decarboxylase subunit beta [Proteiniphilum sp.]MDD3075553.1 sodium ion-translocating decarboxylase subunit beta [Proteiniphilum sp.]MDD3780614.1 sodium ion-translocating decarboxylase subunit beta [Proteiniphilum sp.]